MQALTPIFLLIGALITSTFAIPANSTGALKSRQSYPSANLNLGIYSASSDCSGPSQGIPMKYNTNYAIPTPGGIASYLVSRDLNAFEQMDFSTTGPAGNGFVNIPSYSKFVKTVSPDANGKLLTAGSSQQPQCYSASGEQCVRLWYYT